MNRKDFFENMLIIFIFFPILGVMSLFSAEGLEPFAMVAIPTFFFGVPLGIVIYGFLKYKK